MPRRHSNSAQRKATSQSSLRIIGGQWRRRRIDFPAIDGLRPTPDRVRETLFNWLQTITPGAYCLDLFSGSGALGLEALSRGAAAVTFVDQSAAVAQQLRSNLNTLKCQQGEVITASALDWLSSQPIDQSVRFDLVFLDPPFNQQLLAPACLLLEERNLLRANAVIYLESAAQTGSPDVPANWQLLREKTSGQVSYRLYQRNLPD